MGERSSTPRHESRWPPALTVLTIVAWLMLLPERMRALPIWGMPAIAIILLAPMVGVMLARSKAPWLRLERVVTVLFSCLVEVLVVEWLRRLVFAIVYRSSEVSGHWLLSTAIAAWICNVLAFSLLYWQIDRGGPSGRAVRTDVKPDWLFAQEGAGDAVPADWRPTFVDYLFLAFTTATAFSPTDAPPLTSRAKMLMLTESTLSLAMLVIVASRAINILGS